MINFPLNRDDVGGAEDIWGGNLGFLKGKTPRKKTPHTRGEILPLPTTILEQYKCIKLVGDIMFMNGIRFINTISRHINFMMAEHMANDESSTLQESIRQVKQVYMQRGFKITNFLMDGQFTCIRVNLAELQININICSNDEHAGEIERLNRTIKERFRGIYNTLPFDKLPGRMIVQLVELFIFWLNALPPSP